MPANPPVDFQERAKRPKGTMGTDYPYAISSRDLMENFVYATLDADPSLIEETTGMGGHKQRKIKIPALPTGDDSTQLTSKNGVLSWEESLPDGQSVGDLLKWTGESWIPFFGTVSGQLMQWIEPNGWVAFGSGTANGQLLAWDGGKWEPIASPGGDEQLLLWNGSSWSFLTTPVTGTHVLGCEDGSIKWLETEACD